MTQPAENVPEWARPNETRFNPHFFKREPDGSVRLRMRFTAEEASLIEEAAGDTPLLLYIHRVLADRARYHIREAQKERAKRSTKDSDKGKKD